MMGVGKSTVGKSLAKKLSFNFIDVDKLIEKQEGCSIDNIFKNKSESYFRLLEKKITLKELKRKNSVISLGGGSFLDNAVREEIKNTCISFWLDVNLKILIKRLFKSKKRPLLFGKNLHTEITKIYLERKKTYAKADFRIICGSLRSISLTNKIFKIYEASRDKISK